MEEMIVRDTGSWHNVKTLPSGMAGTITTRGVVTGVRMAKEMEYLIMPLVIGNVQSLALHR